MNFPWIVRTSFREAKRAPLVLLTLVLTVAIGVAGVFGVTNFRVATDAAIIGQSRELLGGDVAVRLRQAFSPELEQALTSYGTAQASELSFGSMVLFPASGQSRLAQVVAVSDGFPLYGQIESNPPEAAQAMHAGEGVLVDSTLLLFFGASVGDRLKIGALEVPVVGELLGAPGSIDFQALVAPRLYLSERQVEATGLLQRGSSLRMQRYIKLADSASADRVKAELLSTLAAEHIRVETAAERQSQLTNANLNVSRFLYVLSCTSLVLCGLGVGSSVQTFFRQKGPSVAVLRCLGATGLEAVLVFVVQIFAGIISGVAAGIGLGIFLEQRLGTLLRDLMPTAEVGSLEIVWPLLQSASISFLLLIWFCAPHILQAYQIGALQSLRADVEPVQVSRIRQALGTLAGTIVVFVVAVLLAESTKFGLLLGSAVLVAILLLLALTRMVLWIVRRARFGNVPFALKQGLANLGRPFNQTGLLLVSVSLSTFLLLVVYFVRNTVTGALSQTKTAVEPNLIVFDVDRLQLDALQQLARDQGMVVLEPTPLVVMRLTAVNGRPVQELIAESEQGVNADGSPKRRRWELTRMYRSTYRGLLSSTEKLIAGEFIGENPADGRPVPVSLEEGIRKELGVSIGDTLEFNVQGVPVTVRVASSRSVDWQRFRANFFVVFPTGVLESAPQSFLFMARADSSAQSANFQRLAVQQYPNISVLDVSLVQQTVDRVLGRIQSAVQLMGGFTMLTAGLVLLAAVLGTKSFRRRENAILKVLGASVQSVILLTAIEYFLLSAIAVGAALLLGHGASLFLGYYFFDVTAIPIGIEAVSISVAVCLGCTLVGVWGSMGTYRIPPASVLRS